MQILPNTRQEATGDHLFAALSQSDDESSTSFADELMRYHSAQKSVDQGENFSVSSALAADQQSTAPLAQAPYSRNTTDGVTYTMDEVCFSKQELHELRQKMEQAGAPAEALTGLDKLAQQPDGATLAQVVASLQQTNAPANLNEADTNTIKSLCERIDSTGKLGNSVLEMLGKGQGKQALELLTQAVNALPADARFTVDKGEMAVLGRALGVSPTAQKQLQGNFGPYSNVSLGKADFASFMAPASSEFLQRDAIQQKLDKAMDATLSPILKKAKARMQAEKEASELSSRRSEQSKTLIQKTMLHNVNATLENTQATQAEQAAHANQTNSAQESMRQSLAARTDKQNSQNGQDGKLNDKPAATAPTTADKGNNAQDKLAVAADGTQNTAPHATQGSKGKEVFTGEDGKDKSKDAKGDKGDKKNSEGWESLLGRTEVRAGAAPTTATATAVPLVGMAAAAQGNTGLENISAQNTTGRGQISRQAASQVEQAMLSAMRDGTKRLELQLHPGELGNLTLMLSVRNGEVSATIRSEKGETAELLNRQMDALRASLEQQGVKVDKLEVQTQLADSNSRQQWEGMQQHNARQEEYARRETLDRMRNLGRARNNSITSDDIALERGVQLDLRTAGNAAQGIYIVA